jgi:hydrogenase expression/formation protein HypC
MCLAVPGRIIELTREADLRFGKVEFGGVRRSVCLEHVPDAQVGDYVLVHVGFALARLDEAEALRELAFLASLGELEDA